MSTTAVVLVGSLLIPRKIYRQRNNSQPVHFLWVRERVHWRRTRLVSGARGTGTCELPPEVTQTLCLNKYTVKNRFCSTVIIFLHKLVYTARDITAALNWSELYKTGVNQYTQVTCLDGRKLLKIYNLLCKKKLLLIFSILISRITFFVATFMQFTNVKHITWKYFKTLHLTL